MKRLFNIFGLSLIIILISGCNPAPTVENVVNEQPPVEEEAPPIEEKCGLENCHGLNFNCGPDVPDYCTEEYQLGDYCRQYAICEYIDDECQLVPSRKLDACVVCVDLCAGLGPEEAFECESQCRQQDTDE